MIARFCSGHKVRRHIEVVEILRSRREVGERPRLRRILYETESWHNIPISNNVGSVKHFLSALRHALEEERHFALVGGLRISNLGSLFIVGVRNSVRPSHLFDHPLRS
jgi:hypothetical protein